MMKTGRIVPTFRGRLQNSPASPHQKKTLIFIHIPRTAGTTLNYILNRHYKPTEIYSIYTSRTLDGMDTYRKLPAVCKRGFKLVRGHFYFGLHASVGGPTSYLTLLRDPVDRIISDYMFTKRDKHNPLSNVLTSKNLTLKDYVESGVSLWTDNVQTRLLAGELGMDRVTPFGRCSEELLEVAKENLDRYFGAVGISERFDEFLLVGRRTYGWSNCFYVKKNTIRNRLPKTGLSEDTLKTIQQFNRFDTALYEYCKKRSDEIVRDLGPSFQRQLRFFQLLNHLAGPTSMYAYGAERRLNALLGRPVHRAH